MIDVTKMALVPAPPECRYVALSYVWGGPGDYYWTTTENMKTRVHSAGLDAGVLPPTIQDAIALTRQPCPGRVVLATGSRRELSAFKTSERRERSERSSSELHGVILIACALAGPVLRLQIFNTAAQRLSILILAVLSRYERTRTSRNVER
ncbi:hypothetical protein EDD16DRAFT_1006841 [Pisolithus croceorrhizus]|nr:hypothetical protein EDD16DRAFT_1006841 [Pisolithus croceorrhizus]